MNGWRTLGSALVTVLTLGLSSSACNDRFLFDVMTMAGAGGAAGSAGAAFSGSAGNGTAGGGRDPGLGGGGTTAAGDAGSGELGGGGTEQVSCGDVAVCPAELHCSANLLCSQCANDPDCTESGLPRCEPIRHRCVACVTTADCDLGYACDSLANRCLKKCEEDVDCKGQHGCDEHRLVCYQCDEDRECAGSPLGAMCATDGSGCVQCRKDTDCPNQHCDQLSGRCVDCRDGLDCPSRLCSPTTFTCLSN